MNKVIQYGMVFNSLKEDDGRMRHFVSGGGAIGDFLDTLNDLDIINEGLSNADYYINGGAYDSDKEFVSSNAYSALLDHSEASIYFPFGDDSHIPLITLPIKDFREILQAWKDFLQAEIKK
jgi:hypothetical protein